MNIQSPPASLRQLAVVLAEAKPMRRGSLSERMVKCSKPGCPCGKDPNARHGPYFSLTHAVQGKTHSRFLSPDQAIVARQQIEAGHEFRAELEKYWKGCEDWADSQLTVSPTDSTEEADSCAAQPHLKIESSILIDKDLPRR
jgi:hypothetical protein